MPMPLGPQSICGCCSPLDCLATLHTLLAALLLAELFKGSSTYTEAVDTFSFGIIM